MGKGAEVGSAASSGSLRVQVWGGGGKVFRV